tara:strand:+ start:360 stop:1484 length:1125 start_codon:yes stop_codon:yes gene_type:complete
MAKNKNQHYVPQFYFKKFSKDGRTICLFNINSKKFVESANIKGQCSKSYFYSKNTQIEKEFSLLEGLGNNLISEIIKNQNISCLNEQEKQNLKSHILFQHGRTEYARDAEEETANALFDMLKPNFLQYAKKEGLKITKEEVNDMKIKSNSKTSLLVSMMSGPLLHDLDMILLENKTQMDFIFSDNPVVFFNSFFNEKTWQGTQGIASTGLQIYFPLNSKFALFIFDPNFYEFTNKEIIKIRNELDIQRLNGLQIIYCNANIYFEDIKVQKPLLLRYNQLKSKRPSQKTTNEVVANRIAEDGTYRELWRTTSTKIKYNLEKLSFLKHKKIDIVYGIRNPQLVEFHNKIMKAVEKGEIKSQKDMEQFFKNNINRPQ